MGSVAQLTETISTQQVAITSPAFGLYNGPPGETADLEVGYATDPAIQPAGDVIASSLPAGRIGRLIHRGAFDGLGSSWERLQSWMIEQGLRPGPVMWELYVTNPHPTWTPATSASNSTGP